MIYATNFESRTAISRIDVSQPRKGYAAMTGTEDPVSWGLCVSLRRKLPRSRRLQTILRQRKRISLGRISCIKNECITLKPQIKERLKPHVAEQNAIKAVALREMDEVYA